MIIAWLITDNDSVSPKTLKLQPLPLVLNVQMVNSSQATETRDSFFLPPL